MSTPSKSAQQKKIEQLTDLAKLSPIELAKAQMFVERQRAKALAKNSTTRAWGGIKGGWPTPLRSRTNP